MIITADWTDIGLLTKLTFNAMPWLKCFSVKVGSQICNSFRDTIKQIDKHFKQGAGRREQGAG